MLSASETSAAAAAVATSVTTSEHEVDADLFAGELANAMSEAAKAIDKVAAALEKLAGAFPGANVTAKSWSGTSEVKEYFIDTGDGSSAINISPDMMEQMAADETMFDRVKEMLDMLLEAASRQSLVNAGGSNVQRNISVENMQIRYVEVQRNSSGTQLSVSSLTLENEQLINDTLDKLLGNRSGNSSSARQTTGFQDLIGGSSNWRLQSVVSMQSLQRVMGSWSGGNASSTMSSATQQILPQINQTVTARLELTIQQWSEAGGSSGTDFMSYIEMMGLCDPLVLDLGDEGINLTSAEDGVYFDIKGDGSPVRTAFITGNNAFLYLDENDNGVADDVSELFGDHGGYANGFEKLAQYDDNGDGVIDENDAVYNQLRVWRDLNGDGVNQAEESMTLADAGVKSINLNYKTNHEFDEHGNVIGERSSFTRSDGSHGLVADVWLKNR